MATLSALGGGSASTATKVETPLARVEKHGAYYATELKVHVDKQLVTMLIRDEHPTGRTICQQIATQLELPSDVAKSFSLWITGKDLELQVRPNLDIYNLVDKWPKYFEKYTHAVPEGDNDAFKLEYRREAMLSKANERKITNVKALQILSDEARSKVVKGLYITSIDDLVSLGGLYLQAAYGDSERADGFIAENIADFVPPKQLKALKASEWERRIKLEHTKHAGKSELIARMLYLQYARQWPYYGAIFFPACKNVPPNGFFEKRTDHLNLGVNADGMFLIDVDKNKVIGKYTYYNTAWESTADTITLECDGTEEETGAAPEDEVMIITPQAPLFDSLANRAVHLLEKQEAKLGQENTNENAIQE